MGNGNGTEFGSAWRITERPPAPTPSKANRSSLHGVADWSGVESPSALDVQVGGGHYKSKGIQPVQYCMANDIGFMEGSVIKYVTRWKDKGGVEDLKKAAHFLDMLIEAQ